MSETLPPPFGPAMRLHLNKLLMNIKNKIPVKWSFLKESLESIQDSLLHRAPEVLHHIWDEIHSILINHFR